MKKLTFCEKYLVNPGIEDGDIESGTNFFSRLTTSVTEESLIDTDFFRQVFFTEFELDILAKEFLDLDITLELLPPTSSMPKSKKEQKKSYIKQLIKKNNI